MIHLSNVGAVERCDFSTPSKPVDMAPHQAFKMHFVKPGECLVEFFFKSKSGFVKQNQTLLKQIIKHVRQ
jgi:hypothetical protein